MENENEEKHVWDDGFNFHKKLRHSISSNCTCEIDKNNPCSKCPKGKWQEFNCIPKDAPTPEPHNFPSFTEMMANFKNAIIDESKAVMMKQAAVTQEETINRYAVCQACEFFEPKQKRCFKCGCFMPVKIKWRSQKCPIGKW